jgi:hypothetical protein
MSTVRIGAARGARAFPGGPRRDMQISTDHRSVYSIAVFERG